MYSWRRFPSYFCLFSVRINEAADFKDHKIQVASCLISLKVEPSPALSNNLLGGPLIKIVLTHMLVRLTHEMSHFPFLWLMLFWGYFLYASKTFLEIEMLFLFPVVIVGCGTPTLSEERGPQFECHHGSTTPLLNSICSIFGIILCKTSICLAQSLMQQLALVSLALWHMWPPEKKPTVSSVTFL